MTSFCKYDIVVVKFPFASSLKYKARPAVIVSSDIYNENSRNTLLILAISSSIVNKLDFEIEVKLWKESGLLKPSIFKSSVATIEKTSVLKKLGKLKKEDINRLDSFMNILC
ncbi:type II toxin-antitoxin system PemK/MazF family toxin [Arcobacter roscoffensis]|uniref:Type II toxin-antitoxin system PemK/MazF family toxin n=1 Tax=Arcobacter roscoffensis TaxID=2961520 RepID=A0ABY5E9B3_9BACT|nr:type II toxin-antitoxin system PemK/MazF family toxin [Arcobacter roscoffensis]UTJ07325.1 type II toxin-antitoxin system PemK/MazF family toxin [Arcobacter roscoffensis]